MRYDVELSCGHWALYSGGRSGFPQRRHCMICHERRETVEFHKGPYEQVAVWPGWAQFEYVGDREYGTYTGSLA